MWEKLKFMMSDVWNFLLPIIKLFMSQMGPVLASVALGAVQMAANGDMSNDERRALAFSAIQEQLTKKGFEVGISVINVAIELAVQKMKEL